MEIFHPWQNYPSELLQYALRHAYSKSEFENRIGYLLLDVSVETILKTFILLPKEFNKSDISFAKRKQILEQNFNDVVNMAREIAKDKLNNVNADHIVYYHSLRNMIYHQATSLTVDKGLLHNYAELSVELLKRLLLVDLTSLLISLSHEIESSKEKENIIKEIKKNRSNLKRSLDLFHPNIIRLIEKAYPQFLSTEFKTRFPIRVDISLDLETGDKKNEFYPNKMGDEITKLIEEQIKNSREKLFNILPNELYKFIEQEPNYKEEILDIVGFEHEWFLAFFAELKFKYMPKNLPKGITPTHFQSFTTPNYYARFMGNVISYIDGKHPWPIEEYSRLHIKELEKIKNYGTQFVSTFIAINDKLKSLL